MNRTIDSQGIRAWARGVLLAATLAVGSQAGETPFQNSTFDANSNGWYWEDWSQPGSSASFDSTQNSLVANTPAISGSLKLNANFNGNGGYSQAVFTIQLPATTDFTSQIGAISFDVRVDPSSTPRSTAPDFGYLETILRQGNNWDWVAMTPSGVHLNGTNWQRVVYTVPKTGVDQIHAVTVKLGENDFAGPVILNIDNITYSTDPDDGVIWNGNGGVVTDPPSAPAGWSWENWSQAGSTVTSETNDFYGRATSGSLVLSNNFSSPSGYSQAVYSFPLPAPVNASTDWLAVNMDVRVDPVSTPRSGGDYGYFEIILRDTGAWNWVATGPLTNGAPTGTRLTGTNWTHISMPIRGGSDIRAITLKLGENNLPGPVVMHVDNITFTYLDAPPPPPTLSVQPTEMGMNLVHTSSDQYGRHNIRTLNDPDTLDQMSFVDKSAPMTYSFDLLSFPKDPPNGGFQAHIFLVPGVTSDSGPDWSAPTLIFLDIKANANSAGGNATFRWKTNQPAANGADANGHGLYVGGLSNLTATSVVGTWGITVSNKTNFVVTGPGGASMTVTLSQEVADLFWTDKEGGVATLNVFFGVQGNNSVNIGQSLRLGGARVMEGATALVSDNFQETELDTSKWMVSGPASGVQFINEPAWNVTWTLPDAGFTNWEWTTNMPSASWTSLDLPGMATPLQLGPAKKQIRVNSADLPPLPAGANQFYMRMVKP